MIHQDSLDLSQYPACLAGVDEVGRGPLAGPVVAAAVILDPGHPIEGLADSKQLSEKRRESLARVIREQALAWSLGRAEVEEIDSINILQASLLAMQRAVAGLPPRAREVFVLHDIEGYRHQEIATLLGVTVGTSKAQLHRARRLLREAL